MSKFLLGIVVGLFLAENVLNLHTLLHTLFEKVPDIKGLRPYTETQKSHQQGGAIVPPCLF